jgi:hypothetical protein
MPLRVRITSIPPGEAPEEVRRAWIGLELPLVNASGGPLTVHAAGVLTGPRGFFGRLFGLASGSVNETSGFVVKVKDAMELLAAKDPAAFEWWRANVPRMFVGNRLFVFAASCGEMVGGEAPAGAVATSPPSRPSLARMTILFVLLLAQDIAIPLGWKYGYFSQNNPRLWVLLAIGILLTLVVGAFILARLRANREAEMERQR